MKRTMVCGGFLLISLTALGSKMPRQLPSSFNVARPVGLGQSEMVVAAGSYQYVPFTVAPSDSGSRWVCGHFTAQGGSGNDIMVSLLTGDGFINFQNGHQAQGYFFSGKETTGTISVGPLGTGEYDLIFDNRFSAFSNKVVQNGIVLNPFPCPTA